MVNVQRKQQGSSRLAPFPGHGGPPITGRETKQPTPHASVILATHTNSTALFSWLTIKYICGRPEPNCADPNRRKA